MIYGMYLSTMGALVQARRHEAIANNLANASTTGFKPDWTIFRSIPAESALQPGHRTEIDALLEKTGGGVWLDRTASNFRSGPFRVTGNPLDLAIEDRDAQRTGFFMVRRPGESQVLYTRNGGFHQDLQGHLVTDSGGLVLSPERDPILLPPGETVRIDKDGVILDSRNNVLGSVGVAETADASPLRKVGDNLFADDRNQVGFTLRRGGIRPEALEESGTNPIAEMAGMIEGHRAYEANMRFLTLQDDTLGQVVTRIAAFA
jgi:flagellar basal body rod protein FlgG